MWADLWSFHNLITFFWEVKILKSNYQNLQKYWIIPVNLWSHSVVFKEVVSKMNLSRFSFSKQLIYLRAGWTWASRKWDLHTKSTSLSETNRNCSPTSGATTSSLPFQQQMFSHPTLTWPFVVTCMPDVGGFDSSDIWLRSINIKVLSSWSKSQSAVGKSVCRSDQSWQRGDVHPLKSGAHEPSVGEFMGKTKAKLIVISFTYIYIAYQLS